MIKRGDSKKMYSKADKDVLTGFIKPPKFLWKPSNHLLRVYILRACYIKNPSKFIIDNTVVEVKITLDGLHYVTH